MKTNLLMFEGIPRLGQIHRGAHGLWADQAEGIPVTEYLVGGLHPASLDGYRVMTAAQKQELIRLFP